MVAFVRSLVLLAATLCLVLAIPTDPTDLRPLPLSSTPILQRQQGGRTSFSWLRNLVIEAIWRIPGKHEKDNPKQASSHSSIPSTFRARFDGDVVLRFKIQSEDEMRALLKVSDTLYLDVWETTDEWVDIRMAKDLVSSAIGLLPRSMRHITYTPLMHDLAQTIHETYPNHAAAEDHSPHRGFTSSLHESTSRSGESRELFFQEYQPLSVIEPWMRLMASLFPSHVQMFSIGSSYENRDIPALRVGVHPTNNDEPLPPRKTLLITGGSHAREWISTSTVNYVSYSLITRYGRFPAITKLLEEFDFVFIPTINPDGYVYTWDTDRLWRKNRQETDLQYCRGIDLDRAFGFAWDGQSQRTNPCAENYAGTGPFEGVESKHLAEWARNETEQNNVNFVTFLDLHSYSQQVLYPYSYSCAEPPPSLEDLQETAMGLAKAFRLTNGHYYGVSSACEGSVISSSSSSPRIKDGKTLRSEMELGGGSALDWFYHELGVKYTYQVKLRDTGSYGFLLPKTHIVPTGQETYNAVVALAKYLLGDKGVEIRWDDEFIAKPSSVPSGSSESEQGDATLREEAVSREELGMGEDDWARDLRRRRRR